ncbi:MAG TPA: DUF6268 family outer membrane beta-barrel protein, partial [Bacteroidia bacterium]|nr:DUF6268 family outer membrane beta-barrel protein [Bacteroidia bacterium]
LLHLKSVAQPYFDIANIYYQQSPDNSLIHSDENPLKTQLVSASVQAAFKIKKDYFIINPFCDYYQLQFSFPGKQELYGTGLSLTYLKQWKNEKWSTAFVAIPRVNSDMKKVDGDDYQIGGALLGIYKKNENLSYKFGVYYNSEFFGPFILPLLGIEWKVSPGLNIFGVLPNQLNLQYEFSKIFYGGIKLAFITNSYRVDDHSFLRINDNHVKINLDTYFTKNIVFNLQAGQSVLRKYRTGFRENGSTNYMNLNVNDGLIFRAGIIYRLRLDEKKETEN